MDPDQARELLADERARIERALAHLGPHDTGEPADEVDPANLASELYDDEFEEGRADDLREELAAVVRAEARFAAGTYGLSIESGKPIPNERLAEAHPHPGGSVRRVGHRRPGGDSERSCSRTPPAHARGYPPPSSDLSGWGLVAGRMSA